MKYKQCIVVRTDLNMGRGKLAAQTAHASILAMERADSKTRQAWMKEGQRKIVLKVQSEEELNQLRDSASVIGIPAALVVDAGLTQLPPGTTTALGIGPAEENKIDRLVGHLKLL